MYPTLGFLSEQTLASIFLESFWTIQISSTFPTTHLMELPASNQPSESVGNAEKWIHTPESPGIKVKISTSNVAGGLLFRNPHCFGRARETHPPFSESVSIRACRPFPTEKYKEHTTNWLLIRSYSLKSEQQSRHFFNVFFCHFNRAFINISIYINHHIFSPRGFFVSFSWKKKRLNVHLYMPSTIDFQRTCHAQTLKLQLKLRLLRAGGSRADGCKWRTWGPYINGLINGFHWGSFTPNWNHDPIKGSWAHLVLISVIRLKCLYTP